MTEPTKPNESDHVEELVRKTRGIHVIAPPEDLRELCLPGDPPTHQAARLSLWELLTMQRWQFVKHAALPVSICFLCLVVVCLSPLWFQTQSGSAAILEAVISGFDEISAVHIATRVDDGVGTPTKESWEVWSVRGLGHRSDSEGSIRIYNIPKGTLYVLDRASNVVTTSKLEESALTLEFLRRGEAEKNVHALIVQAKSKSQGFGDELVQDDGREFRRMKGTDTLGRPIIVDIDPATNRVIRTQSWTHASEHYPSVRSVVTFDYPAAHEIESTHFELVIPEGVAIQQATPDQEALRQCMTNLQDIFYALMQFSEMHDGRLPSEAEMAVRQWEGFRESMLFCPLSRPGVTFSYIWRLSELDVDSLYDVKWDVVLLECKQHAGGAVQVYAGGHAMFVPDNEE